MNKTNILNAKISNATSYEEVYRFLSTKYSVLNSPKYITVNNAHTVVETVKNVYYRQAINNSFLALPDGKPLSVVAKLKGEKNIIRIFGPTLFEKVLEWGQKDGLKHYFFGSAEVTLDKMLTVIKKKYPKTIISGIVSPPYKEFTKEENEKFLADMNESGADIFWIGLGAPKQELWMYENYEKLNRGVMVGIGAGFDYMAGNLKHAPEWMKNLSLEWLFRLMMEPKRLWKRYFTVIPLFIYYNIIEFLKGDFFKKK